MRKLMNVSIKILLLYIMVNHGYKYLYHFITIGFKYNEMDKMTIIWLYIIPLITYIILCIFTWKFSNRICEKIIDNIDEYSVEIKYNEILSIIIIALCIYSLMNSLEYLIYNICYLVFHHTLNIKLNENLLYGENYINYTHYISPVISSIINIGLSLIILKLRKRIIKIFEKI